MNEPTKFIVDERSPRFCQVRAGLERSPLQFNLRTLMIAMAACAVLSLIAKWAGGASVVDVGTWLLALLTVAAAVYGLHRLTRLAGVIEGGFAALGALALLSFAVLTLQAEAHRYADMLNHAGQGLSSRWEWHRIGLRDVAEPYFFWLRLFGSGAAFGMPSGAAVAGWTRRRRRQARAQATHLSQQSGDALTERFHQARGTLLNRWKRQFSLQMLFIAVFVAAVVARFATSLTFPDPLGLAGWFAALALAVGGVGLLAWRMRQPLILACGLGTIVSVATVMTGYARMAELRAPRAGSFGRFVDNFWEPFAGWLSIFGLAALVGIAIGAGIIGLGWLQSQRPHPLDAPRRRG